MDVRFEGDLLFRYSAVHNLDWSGNDKIVFNRNNICCSCVYKILFQTHIIWKIIDFSPSIKSYIFITTVDIRITAFKITLM